MLDRIFARWPLKLLALVLAFAIWLSVTGEKRVPRDFRVPLDVAIGEEFIVYDLSDQTVEVRLRGPESVLEGIERNLTLQFSVRNLDPGEHGAVLTADSLRGVPRGTDVEWVEPDRVTLRLDRRARATLPVEPVILGEPAGGFAFYGMQVLPASLQVEGPQTEVEEMTRLPTEPIRLDGRRERFSVRVAAVPDRPEVRPLDSRRLEVRIEIDAAPETAAFDGIGVSAPDVAGATIEPSEVDVTVQGPPRLLTGLRAEQIRATVDSSGLSAGGGRQRAPVRIEFIDIPARDAALLSAKAVKPEKVSVRLTNGEGQ